MDRNSMGSTPHMSCAPSVFAQTEDLTEEKFWEYCEKAEPIIDYQIRKTEDEDEQQRLKKKLSIMVVQGTFAPSKNAKGVMGRWRNQNYVELNGKAISDFDHLEEDPHEIYNRWLEAQMNFEQLGILAIFKSPRGHGLKVVSKCDIDLNLFDNQRVIGEKLGLLPYLDESCKDASRATFFPKKEDVLYLNPEFFTCYNPAYGEKWNDYYRKGQHLSETASTPTAAPQATTAANSDEVKRRRKKARERKFHGKRFADIIKELWPKFGGEPKQGERNTKLHRMARHLATICDNDEQFLFDVMSHYGLPDDEMKAIIRNVCKEPYMGITKELKEIVGETTSQQTPKSAGINAQLEYYGHEIEKFFGIFPILREVCQGLAISQYPAAVFAAACCMDTLMTRCYYFYYYQPYKKRRLNSICWVVGDAGSGKGFATELVDNLLKPVKESDDRNEKELNQWKEGPKVKDGVPIPRPKEIIRTHLSCTSNSQFLTDMGNAFEYIDGEKTQLHLFNFDNELDQMTKQNSIDWKNKHSLMLKAFHNEEDGQNYYGNEYLSVRVNITWNNLLTGTRTALANAVNDANIMDGLCTRLTIIPFPYSEEWGSSHDAATLETFKHLQEAAQKLDRTKGELPVKKLTEKLYEWGKSIHEDIHTNSKNVRTDIMLLNRCGYHGLNHAIPYIHLRHWDALYEDKGHYCGSYETDDMDWQFTLLLTQIQHTCSHYFWEAMINRAYERQDNLEFRNSMQRRSKSVEAFDKLPQSKPFTVNDLRQAFGLGNDASARVRMNRLISEGLVEECGTFKEGKVIKKRYRKTGQPMI